MKKELILGVLIGSLATAGIGAIASAFTAASNIFPVQLNGQNVDITGYNINDETYFKLRDISSVVGGFDVGFNNNIIQISKDGYTYDSNIGKSIFSNLSSDERRKLNVFFSNFSEVGLYKYNKNAIDMQEMIDFAFFHNLCNNGKIFMENIDNLYYFGTCMGITGETFDNTIKKYFDMSIIHRGTVHQTDAEVPIGWVYQDDKFFGPVFSDFTSDIFSAVTDMYELNDGTYMVYLNSYQLPLDKMNTVHNSTDYYSYDLYTASNDSDCELLCKQSAIIKPHTYNDINTWALLNLNITENHSEYID